MLFFIRGPCRLSIHRQIMTIALAPALVVTGLLVFVIYQGNVQFNQRLLNQQGQLLAAQLAAALEYGLATGALAQLPAIVEAAVQPATAILGTPVRSVTVTDRNDQLLYRWPTANPALPVPAPLIDPIVASVEEQPLRFAAPVLLQPLSFSTSTPAPRLLGRVDVELSVAAAQAHWQRRLLWDLGGVLLAFAGAVGLAHWTGRRLSGAIRQIAGAIQRIKNGDLAARVRQTDACELGTLQEGVNLLADAIERSKARLDGELAEVRSEYQQTLEALQVQSRAAERANQAKSLFLAKVSHEMRTPLYSIQGLIEQLLKVERAEAETRTLRTISAAAETLYRHISDILDFTQLEKGKYAPTHVPLEVRDELDAVAAPLEPLLVPRGLYLDVIVARDVPPAVESDRKAFHAILANLLGNAVKYTESGGIVVQIEVSASMSDANSNPTPVLRVRVSDTGCGIPPDRLETIFAPFEQVDEALNRRHAGTGLGLSIVKGYCELLGGRVSVASALDDGSIFTIELPLRLPVEPMSVRPPAAIIPAGLRALVADERASFRASVSTRLADLGIAVVEYTLSPTALAVAPVSDPLPDLLVTRDLSGLSAGMLPTVVAGLRRQANRLVALETRCDTEVEQRLRQGELDLILWSGVTRDPLRVALARVFQENTPSTISKTDPITPFSPPRLPLSGWTVLVVEDYAINRTIMAHQLHGNGARVLEATDGDSAVARAAEPGLDLILMDIQMPGKDGIAAIREIRALPALDRLLILGFTASADKPTHQRILAAGADGVLTKPLGEVDLIRAVRRATRRHRLTPAIRRDEPGSGD